MRTLYLRTRLLVGFAVMAALVIGFAGHTLLRDAQLREQVQYLAGQNGLLQDRLQDLRETLSGMELMALQAAVTRDQALLRYAKSQAQSLFDEFGLLRTQEAPYLGAEDARALLAFLDQTETLYRTINERTFATFEAMAAGAEPARPDLDRMRLDSVQLNSAFGSFLTSLRGSNAIRLAAFEREIRRLRAVGIATAATAIVAMAAFLWLMRHYLTRPLRQLDKFVAEIRDPTTVSRRAVIERADEIGEIAAALNRMLDGLHETAISRDHFNQVIANLSTSLLVLDGRGVIDTVNPAACRTLGRTAAELIGRRGIEALPKRMAKMFRTEGGLIELTVPSATGERTPMLVSATRLPEAQGGGWIVSGTDITERKRAEDEIRRALDQQIELNDMKTRFVSMTSHEFRTPLSAILSSSELLRDYGDRLTAAERADLITGITGAVKRMAQMLDNVLLIGRADAGHIDFHPTPVPVLECCTRIANEAARATARDATDASRLVIRGERATIIAPLDEKLLRHIVGNLVSNAFKYSPAGGAIEFDIVCTDAAIELTVTDHGIGIPAEHRPHLFETFRRAGNVGTIAGTGLGLAIVRHAVDVHGGRITVDSAPGKGTRVTVSLPR